MSDIPSAHLLSAENSQTSTAEENVVNVDATIVVSNKDNASTASAGLEGVDTVESTEEANPSSSKKRKKTSEV